jgi:hypothetical protein
MTMHYDFCATMEAGKAAAARRRNPGRQGGTVREVKIAQLAPVDAETFEYARLCAVARWDSARADAVEDFRRAAFPDRYELEF